MLILTISLPNRRTPRNMDDSYGGWDMSLTDSYKSRDLEPGVILTKFLISERFSAT